MLVSSQIPAKRSEEDVKCKYNVQVILYNVQVLNTLLKGAYKWIFNYIPLRLVELSTGNTHLPMTLTLLVYGRFVTSVKGIEK